MSVKYHSIWIVVVLLAAFTVMPQPAMAALSCSLSMTDVDFGTINTAQNVAYSTSGVISANCSGGTANGAVRICISFGDGTGTGSGSGSPRYMKSGANTLNYNIYQDSGQTTLLGNGGPFGTRAELDLTLNASGIGNGSKTAYGHIPASQTAVPQGNYSSGFPAYHVLSNYGYTNQGTCAAGNMPTSASEPTFNVLARNSSSCSISATTHNFGSVLNLTSNVNTTSTVTAACSPGTPYSIGLNAGNGAGATVAARKMTRGASTITYTLYSNSGRTTVWGNTIGTNTVSGTANGYGQNYTVYGRAPAQATPPAGTYTDTVVVTITY